ncbi:MAG: HAD-IA family hydrolase [Candidatus Edwardsbacteria bacterium]
MDDSICRGKTQPQELWKRIKKESGYIGDDIDFVPFWVKHFQPNADVHKLIRDVSKSHPVGLMTNIYPGVYAKAVESGNIPRLPYAFVLQSCDTGFVKPEHEIYETAERMSGQKAKDILLIDDSPRFIAPAKERGWQTFTFNANSPNTSTTFLRDGFGI